MTDMEKPLSFVCKLAEDEKELAGAWDVRREVFVTEQGIVEDLVYDAGDAGAAHIVIKNGDEVIGTARLQFPCRGEAKLERMAVLPRYRSMGGGRQLINFVLDMLRRERIGKLVLHAQYDVVEFYKKCGFITFEEPFIEAGIKHIKMERKLQ